MAKSKNYFSLRRGSTKSHTFQVVNGQQITKDRVYEVRNPRSDGQMTQRTTFLSAIRFYQRANQRYFPYAFEDKKQTESEYNAFMRHNAKIGGYITGAQGASIYFPLVAPWMISQGSLASLPFIMGALEDGSAAVKVALEDNEFTPMPTVGVVSGILLRLYPNLREGDIITFVAIASEVAGTDWVNNFDMVDVPWDVPFWNIKQFAIDSQSETSLEDAGLFIEDVGAKHNLCLGSVDNTYQVGGCVTVSRVDASGTKVSMSVLKLNDAAEASYEMLRSNAHREQVLAWWGAQQPAILQGALVL